MPPGIATHLLARGENLRTIQSLLGHATIQATTFYTHVATQHIKDATEGMFDKMFNNGLSTDNKAK
jgi:site-specific recombinase XerD